MVCEFESSINKFSFELCSNSLISRAKISIPIKRTLSTGEVINTTYNSSGSVATMTNNTGTTTYHYNLSGNLSGIDYPSGSSIKYEYDILYRVVKVTEKASLNAIAAVTLYTYDEVGNIKTVIDPVGGVTVMIYDKVNRLTEKTLPNGIKSIYTYNDLDQVMSIALLSL